MFGVMMLAAALAAEPTKTPTVSTEEAAQIQLALNRGQLLYRYDQSAWHVTDAAMAALSKDSKQSLKGYVTVPDGDTLRTTFYGGDDSTRFRVYSAVWDGTKAVSVETYSPEAKVPVSQIEASFIKARDLALTKAGTLENCSNRPFNSVVLPPERAGGPTAVYLFAPQTTAESVPMGGHYRLEVLNGEVVAQRAFTKSCISLPTKVGIAQDKKGSSPEALMITHLLDPTPTEIHVFSVFAAGLPIFVGVANNSIYAVEAPGGQARIRKIQ